MTRSIKYENVFYEIFISDGVAMDMSVSCTIFRAVAATCNIRCSPARSRSTRRRKQLTVIAFSELAAPRRRTPRVPALPQPPPPQKPSPVPVSRLPSRDNSNHRNGTMPSTVPEPIPLLACPLADPLATLPSYPQPTPAPHRQLI